MEIGKSHDNLNITRNVPHTDIHTAPYNATPEQKSSSCNLKRNVNSDLSTYQTQLNSNTDRHGISLIIETMPKYEGNYNLV